MEELLLLGERETLMVLLLLLCNKVLEGVERKGFGRRGRRREKEGEKGGAGIPVNS